MDRPHAVPVWTKVSTNPELTGMTTVTEEERADGILRLEPDGLVLEVAMLRPVIARSLRRARALAESLDARGFDPVAPRAVRRPLVMRSWELVLLAAAGGITLAATAARLLFAAYTSELVYFPGLRSLYGFVRAWL